VKIIKKTASIILLIIILSSGTIQAQDNIKSTFKPGEKKTFAGFVMSFIPGNESIPDFYMGRYEITQKQYISVMGKIPKGANNDKYNGKTDEPVRYVTWYEAIEFCNKLSKKAGLKLYYSILQFVEWITI